MIGSDGLGFVAILDPLSELFWFLIDLVDMKIT